MRATDGQRAQLKIGTRIPIATGSYNAGVSTGVASIGVQTQFTYVDVGVILDITPTVHYDHEVTLKMHIEVTAHQGDQTISGVTEPIIAQNITDQVIQLKDGEPSLLAGLITRQDSLNVNGTPGVGELPLLKYFFTSRDKTVAKDEIVFLLVPHIVRESVLSIANTRPIDTGTGTSIELRRDSSLAKAAVEPANAAVRARTPAQSTSAANAASAMARQLSQQSEPAAPPAAGQSPATQAPATQSPVQSQAQPSGAPAGAPISFSVVPANPNQSVGGTFQVAVMLNNAHDVFSVPLQVKFNPAVLELVNVDSGDFLSRDGQLVSISHRDDGNGLVAIAAERPPNAAGVSGQGSICTLTFKAIAAGDSDLALVKVGAHNSAQANLPAVGSQAVVHVK
jgi:general secretion pathway protein D